MTEVLENLETELGTPLNVISQDKRHFVVNCPNQVELTALLDLDGCKLDGGVLRVQRAEYSMSGDDMLQFVKQLLETDDELSTLRRSYDMPPLEKRVNAVQGESRGAGSFKKRPIGLGKDLAVPRGLTHPEKARGPNRKVHAALRARLGTGSLSPGTSAFSAKEQSVPQSMISRPVSTSSSTTKTSMGMPTRGPSLGTTKKTGLPDHPSDLAKV